MDTKLVTVTNFQYLPEAEAARMHLEAEGVPAFLVDAETINMDWLLGNAIGYIKLQVPLDRADEARTMLDEIQEQRARAAEVPERDDVAKCLACGAEFPADRSACSACGWTYADEASEPPEEEKPARSEETAPLLPPTEAMEWFRDVKRPMLLQFLAPTFGLLLGALVTLLAWLLGAFDR